jgi:hypothetical protein
VAKGLGQFIKDFGSNLWSELQSVLSAIGSFLSSFFSVWDVSIDDFDAIRADFEEIKANVQAEIMKLQKLHKPEWKTRVINVPRAMEAVHDMIELIRDDLFTRAEDCITPLHDLVLIWKSEKASIESSMDKPNAMVRASSFLHSVETAIHQVRSAMDAAKDVTELATEITDKLNGLDLIFLQQGNPRVRLKGTISARAGKLHASA